MIRIYHGKYNMKVSTEEGHLFKPELEERGSKGKLLGGGNH